MAEVVAYTFQPHFYDFDLMGIAHNVAYIRWMENARAAFLDASPWPMSRLWAEEFAPAITRTEIQYVKPIRLYDPVAVQVHVLKSAGRPGRSACVRPMRVTETLYAEGLQSGYSSASLYGPSGTYARGIYRLFPPYSRIPQISRADSLKLWVTRPALRQVSHEHPASTPSQRRWFASSVPKFPVPHASDKAAAGSAPSSAPIAPGRLLLSAVTRILTPPHTAPLCTLARGVNQIGTNLAPGNACWFSASANSRGR